MELPLPPVPKSYSFGVRVINDNGNISPAATWSFRVKSAEGSGSSSGGPADNNSPVEPHDTKLTVKFDSIAVLNDHDPDTLNPLHPDNTAGEWTIWAFVQGKQVTLLQDTDVISGKTIKFKPGTEVTVKLDGKNPLSIFTAGVEEDCGSIMEFLTDPIKGFNSPGNGPPPWTKDISDLFVKLYSNPSLDWKDKINALQYKIGGYMIDSCCYNPSNRLGTLNLLFSPPDYITEIAPAPEPHFPDWFPEFLRNNTTPSDHKNTSSLKDFILKYTVTVEH